MNRQILKMEKELAKLKVLADQSQLTGTSIEDDTGSQLLAEEEKKVAIKTIHQDAVYREDREREESEAAEGEGSGRGNQRSEGINTNIRHVLSSVDKRRAELLAARVSEPESGRGGGNLMDKISSEIKQLIAITPQVSSATDPMRF